MDVVLKPVAPATSRRLGHRDVLAIALPITISNATVPLIGFADAAVIGQLGEAHLLGAVALSANIFNFIYFLFGFLRMGTTGLTAQAVGAANSSEIAANLIRPLMGAAIIGSVLVALQALIIYLALAAFSPSERVATAAKVYFDIRIWAAPAGLANFALIGWFIGLGRAAVTFYLQLLLNGLNILLAIAFVAIFEWGVGGVALAALIAEYIAAAAGLVIALREMRRQGSLTSRADVLNAGRLHKLFDVSRDIMIRTLCIQAAFAFFVAQGARTDDLTLAANAVLYSMMMVAIYMIDGFAYAAETLVGQAVGAQRRDMYGQAIRLTTLWAFGLSVILAIVLLAGGGLIVDFVTTNVSVREASHSFLMWAALVPLTSVWCFQLDGIFIGATDTRTMRNMMLWAVLAYFAAWYGLHPLFGNHGLWMAVHVFFLARAVALGSQLPELARKSFPAI
ncbi:MAG TPA: MATE family efflux transporter [Hyphomicrobiaceae bacterium]|nr:MATE family efflux transporter [Hyphomicrobiaceae bacterium]